MSNIVKIRSKYLTIPEIVFFVVWTIYSIYNILLGASMLSSKYADMLSILSKPYRYTTLIFLAIAFFIDVFTIKSWEIKRLIFYVFFLTIFFAVGIYTNNMGLLFLILFIFAAQGIDFNRFLRYDIILKIFMFLAILLLCAFGVITNRTEIINGSFKMSLGFAHPNTFACFALTILVEWLCFRFKKIKWFEWIILLVAIFAIYGVSKSRASVYTFIAVLVLYFIANYREKLFHTKIIRIILTIVPSLMAFLSFYTVYLYSKGIAFAIELNSALTGRLNLSEYALQTEGIKFFGQEVTFSSITNSFDRETNILVDNAYLHIAISWGALITCIIVIMYTVRFFKWSKEGNISILLMALFFIVLGFGETYMIQIIYNITLLCIFGMPNCLLKKDRTLEKVNNNLSLCHKT